MKSLKNILLISLLAVVSMPSNAVQPPKPESNDLLCDLLGINCTVVNDKDTGGRGKEPPKNTGQ